MLPRVCGVHACATATPAQHRGHRLYGFAVLVIMAMFLTVAFRAHQQQKDGDNMAMQRSR